VNRPMAGHFERAGLPPTERLVEFRVSEDAVLPVGTPITARHFVPGQLVDVTGLTAGKGYAGVMKKWGFGGLRASHGVSVSHRSLGSTGNSQDPGKVWKGKKMSGRMGQEQRTIERLTVYKIDVKNNLVYVKGAVPGKAGTIVKLRDALRATKGAFPPGFPPPFPTYYADDEDRKLMEAWEEGEFLPASEVEALRESGSLPADFVEQPPYEIVMPAPETDPMAPEEGGEEIA
jgi:large subunit ribosomal protein L3